jgi:DNA primase
MMNQMTNTNIVQSLPPTLLDVSLEHKYEGSYFEQRGVSKEIFQKFNLGTVVSAVNTLPSSVIGSPAFPVYDESGYFVGWIFRPGHQDFKYRYHGLKTFDYVYGLVHAIPAIIREGSVIIVEGPFDVLLAHSAGIENVIAVLGAHISVNQILLLGSYTNKFIFALDSDKAGLEGMDRSIQLVNKILPEVSTDRMLLYPYKDFADYALAKIKNEKETQKNQKH